MKEIPLGSRLWSVAALCALSGGTTQLAAQQPINGGFESGTAPWSKSDHPSGGYVASLTTTSMFPASGAAAARVDVSSIGAGAAAWRVRLQQGGLSIDAGTTYTLSCQLRGDQDGMPVWFLLQKNSSPYTVYGYTYATTSSAGWQQLQFEHVASVDLDGDARLVFWFGKAAGTYYFDDVQLSSDTSATAPNAVTDWSQVGYPGEIPLRPVGADVTEFGAVGDGIADDTSAVQTALDGLDAGYALLLPAGDYRLTDSLIIPEGVSVRGAGAGQTKLVFDLQGSAVTPIPITRFDRGAWVGLTGYSTGSDVVSVADASSFVVGQHVQIVQDNDPAVMYTQPEFNAAWAEDSVGEVARVVSIDGQELTLDRPLSHDYSSQWNPRLRRFRAIEGIGIEELKIERLSGGDASTILFKHAARCWVRNVESAWTDVAHVWMSISAEMEVRRCWFHESHDYGGGGHGYGVVVGENSVGCLVEDNIFDTLRHALMLKEGACANVLAYNYSTNPVWTGAGTPADIVLHGHFPAHNLIEGNVAAQIISADYWGPSGPGNAFLRNRVDSAGIQVLDHSHGHDVVSNSIQGGLTLDGTVQQTWIDANDIDGTVQPAQLTPPQSHYLSAAPEWWSVGLQFPAFGPDVSGGGTIPAEQRFVGGTDMVALVEYDGFRDGVLRTGEGVAATVGFATASQQDDRKWRRELVGPRQKLRALRREVLAARRLTVFGRYEQRLKSMDEHGELREAQRRGDIQRMRRMLRRVNQLGQR